MKIIPVQYKSLILYLSIFNLIFAVLFLVWSEILIRLNRILKKYISTEGIMQALNKMHDIDARIISMRKLLGIVCIILAGLFAFFYFFY